jgi:uncharacterized UPF0160 family protein
MIGDLISRSFGTHDGSFHADEVTACSLLLLFRKIDCNKVFRTRNPSILAHCEYICDVGGEYEPLRKRFDHHQAEYKGPLSSAGMTLLYLRECGTIDPGLYDYFNQTLIMGVDAHDTGVARIEIGTSSFSQVIGNFLPIEYEAAPDEMMKAFFKAVDFVVDYLDRLRQRYLYIHKCKAIVREKMSEGGYAMIFDTAVPWMESFFEMGGETHPAEFVIMPTGSHWKLRGIPPNMADRMNVRRPLPESWAGLRDADLQKVCGVPGAVFCHKGRFISIWQTKEDALKALHIVLQRKGL